MIANFQLPIADCFYRDPVTKFGNWQSAIGNVSIGNYLGFNHTGDDRFTHAVLRTVTVARSLLVD